MNNRKTQKRRVRGGSGSVNKIGENLNEVILKKLKQKLERTKNVKKYFIHNIDIYQELKYDCKNVCKKIVVGENQPDSVVKNQLEDMMKNKPEQDWGNFCKNVNAKKCQQFIQKRTELDFIYLQVKNGEQYSDDLKKDIETLYFTFVEKPKVEEKSKVENLTPGLFTNSKRYTKKNTAMKNINENTAMKNTTMKNTTRKTQQ
jgi:hypothetical protein